MLSRLLFSPVLMVRQGGLDILARRSRAELANRKSKIQNRRLKLLPFRVMLGV